MERIRNETNWRVDQFSLLKDTTKKYIPAHQGVQNLEEKRDSLKLEWSKQSTVCEPHNLRAEETRNAKSASRQRQ